MAGIAMTPLRASEEWLCPLPRQGTTAREDSAEPSDASCQSGLDRRELYGGVWRGGRGPFTHDLSEPAKMRSLLQHPPHSAMKTGKGVRDHLTQHCLLG